MTRLGRPDVSTSIHTARLEAYSYYLGAHVCRTYIRVGWLHSRFLDLYNYDDCALL